MKEKAKTALNQQVVDFQSLLESNLSVRRRTALTADHLGQSHIFHKSQGTTFGSHTHSGESAPMLFDTMQHVFKMDMVDGGALSLKEAIVETRDGTHACHDYGKTIRQEFTA